MTQFSEKHQQSAPASQPAAHTTPKTETSSLSSQTSKLNLAVKVPQKAGGPKLDSVQLKSDPNAAAEPGQMTDMDVINAVTHLIKSATVHPLGSSTANKELRNQKANLENNKDVRAKAADQASKNQQVIEQDKIQQKNTIERTNTKEGPGQAGKEAKAEIKTDKVIKTGIAKNDAVTEHKPIEQAQKEVQKFKEEHSKSQSAANANVSALASRNTSTEGEKEGLSRDLVRERASEKSAKSEQKVEAARTEIAASQLRAAAEPRVENRVESIQEFKLETRKQEVQQEIKQEIKQEVRQAENRAIEVQRRFVQAASVQAHAKNEVQQQDVEDDIFDSWERRDDRRKVARKKKKTAKQQLTKETKRALRRMTPLERRKAKLRREKARRMRKRSRRKNRTLVFR